MSVDQKTPLPIVLILLTSVDICSLAPWGQSMDVGGKTLGTKAMCAAPVRSVYHVFMAEYTQVTQLHQNLYLCSIHKAVTIASLACCTSEKRRMAKDMVEHFAGCFTCNFFFFSSLGPAFHAYLWNALCREERRGACVSGHCTHQTCCSLSASADVPDCWSLCSAQKMEIMQKSLLGQRTTVKSFKDERENFGLWKQGCKFWQSLKM